MVYVLGNLPGNKLGMMLPFEEDGAKILGNIPGKSGFIMFSYMSLGCWPFNLIDLTRANNVGLVHPLTANTPL